MNVSKWLLLVTLLSINFLHADDFDDFGWDDSDSENEEKGDVRFEFRTAAFFPSSSLYRKIYGSTTGSYQLEISQAFKPCFEAWANLEWITKKGHSPRLNSSTHISILNLSAGFKYPYALSESLTAYIGFGPIIGVVFVDNKLRSSDVSTLEDSPSHHQKKGAYGVIIKSGIYYLICPNFFIDVFADYGYLNVKFNSSMNLGGFRTGAGIGYTY